jgi:hypothetical protein
MERRCAGETPVGYFTLNYYSLSKNSTKCSPMICSLQFTFFFNLIKMYVMKSERNITLKVVDDFKFRSHKMLKNDIQHYCCTVNTYKYFFEI